MTDEEIEREAVRFELGRQQTIEGVLGIALGYASVCWIPRPAGEFDSRAAGWIVDDTADRLAAMIVDLQGESLASIDSLRQVRR